MPRFMYTLTITWFGVILITCACANSADNADTSGTDSEVGSFDTFKTDNAELQDTTSVSDTSSESNIDEETETDSDTNGDMDTDEGTKTETETETETKTETETETTAETNTDSSLDNETDKHQDSDSAADTSSINDSEVSTDTNSLTDSEVLVGSGSGMGYGELSGTVMSPSGDLPIPKALVYLTKDTPDPIPQQAFDYECDNMTGRRYAFSGPDGSWQLNGVPEGEWKIVTRKGHFRRVRDIVVVADQTVSVPVEVTTLPGESNGDGTDNVPNYAVLLAYPDKIFNLLAKFGMGETDSLGNLQFGTESFTAFSDRTTEAGYPDSSALFADIDTLMQYHMIFLPCYAANLGVDFARDHAAMLREYVSRGGKIYNSCCVALWTEAAFPDYIDFHNETSSGGFDVGRISPTSYETEGRVLDSDMAAWLEVVTDEDVDNYPFINGYVQIEGLNDVDDGHGLKADNGMVKPYSWVEDVSTYTGSPLMVTYDYDAGKVFYSVYETSLENPTDDSLTPQEYVLLYVILEVGVCQDLVII